jgi:glycerol-3-phosphate dehydrogenase subunit C
MTTSDSPVSFQASDGLCYVTDDPKYWSPEALGKEITRAFALCHSCRMCFKYCDAFPVMFDLIDSKNEDVNQLTAADIDKVMKLCFQCKLCEVQCPYTPREQHEFQLDFPKLVHRYFAQQAKGKGKTLGQWMMSNTNSLGTLARLSLGMANLANRFPPERWFLEKIAGIHRKKLLPDFAFKTFSAIAKSRGWVKKEKETEIVIFQTCYVENNEPEIGKDLIEVLEKNQVKYTCLDGYKCCGMPYWEIGDLDTVRINAHHNLNIMMPYIDAGAKVMAINPTCAMMMRREYPELLEGVDKERAKKLSAAMVEPAEFLWSIRKEDRFNKDFKSLPGKSIAYHISCHLRSLGVGFRSREIFKQMPEMTVKVVAECCGHNGTFAMKTESFEDSGRIGKKAFDAMEKADADIWTTDCPLAAVQFKQFTGTKPIHPMTLLARAYKEDGFKK